MLQDPKARRLATEFFGQWLGFYQFDRYRGVDAERFPEFYGPVQLAMYEEAQRFFEHLVRQDRPVEEILDADYAFLNAALAKHYGIEGELPTGEPIKVENLSEAHRGGLFGLGAVLTVTSAPLRTSPVRRGDWILHRVLGTPVPPPPANVGFLPADEVQPDGLTLRERLEAHRTDTTCMNCHTRIDPLGFALEHYDSLGRWRETYRDGQAIDPSGTLSDGTTISGVDGLKNYLKTQAALVRRTLCAKLVGYAFGRNESLADAQLIDEMLSSLEGDSRFSSLVVRIVASRQFREHRGRAPGLAQAEQPSNTSGE
jgi:hypothetical protein